MTTPNTDLAEQIARALFEEDVDGPDTFEEAASWYRRNAAAVLPIVDAAVKRGQAEALRDAADLLECRPLDSPDAAHTPNWLYDRADEIEKETPDEQ